MDKVKRKLLSMLPKGNEELLPALAYDLMPDLAELHIWRQTRTDSGLQQLEMHYNKIVAAWAGIIPPEQFASFRQLMIAYLPDQYDELMAYLIDLASQRGTNPSIQEVS